MFTLKRNNKNGDQFCENRLIFTKLQSRHLCWQFSFLNRVVLPFNLTISNVMPVEHAGARYHTHAAINGCLCIRTYLLFMKCPNPGNERALSFMKLLRDKFSPPLDSMPLSLVVS